MKERTAVSIRYELISDRSVYAIPYSFHTVFIIVFVCTEGQCCMKTYGIHLNQISCKRGLNLLYCVF